MLSGTAHTLQTPRSRHLSPRPPAAQAPSHPHTVRGILRWGPTAALRMAGAGWREPGDQDLLAHRPSELLWVPEGLCAASTAFPEQLRDQHATPPEAEVSVGMPAQAARQTPGRHPLRGRCCRTQAPRDPHGEAKPTAAPWSPVIPGAPMGAGSAACLTAGLRILWGFHVGLGALPHSAGLCALNSQRR